MNIYLIQQDENSKYDSYDSAVVVAKTARRARMIHPSRNGITTDWSCWDLMSWTDPKHVRVRLIGTLSSESYAEGDVILASYNAG